MKDVVFQQLNKNEKKYSLTKNGQKRYVPFCPKSGTKNTVDYAKKQGLIINNVLDECNLRLSI